MGLPLEGLRVIDLTQDFAGPFCTMILSDLGAEVIKIEKADGGDETRRGVHHGSTGQATTSRPSTAERKSVVLDLKKPTFDL